MPKCMCILIDRGKATTGLGKFNVNIGTMGGGLFSKPYTFYIPEEFRNITLEKHGLMKSSVMPLFIIDAKSCQVLNYIQNPEDGEVAVFDKEGKPVYDKDGKQVTVKFGVDLTAKHDPEIRLKLKVLIKEAFWEMLARRLKTGILLTLIYMGAGYGIVRFIEYLITMLFAHTGF